MRLFSAQGYANTSLSQVAKDADVSKALIFWHFDNKETSHGGPAHARAVFHQRLDDLAGLSEVDQMKRLTTSTTPSSRRTSTGRFFLSLILRDEKHPDDLTAHGRPSVFLNLLADILESGRQKGFFREDIRRSQRRSHHERAARILVQGFLGDDSPERGTRLVERLKARLVDALRREPAVEKS